MLAPSVAFLSLRLVDQFAASDVPSAHQEHDVVDPSLQAPKIPRRARLASLQYARTFNKAANATGLQKQAGQHELDAARAQMTRGESSIMDMVAGRGAMMTGVARITGQPLDVLWKTYLGACSKLATFYGFSNYF